MKRRRWLRRTVWSLTGLLCALVLMYAWATRPARLRAELQGLLARVEHAELIASDISFSPWGGLEVADLQLRLDKTSPLYPRLAGQNKTQLLSVDHAQIQFDTWALLRGEFWATEISISGLRVTVVRDVRSGQTNWSLAETDPAAAPRRTQPRAPRVLVRPADVQVWRLDDDSAELQRRWVLEIAGAPREPGARLAAAYVLRAEQVGGSGAPVRETVARRRALAELQFRPAGLIGSLDWIDLELLQPFLPPAIAHTFSDMRLVGQVCLEHFEVGDGRIYTDRLRWSDVSLVLPVERDADPDFTHPRFLRLEALRGTGSLHLGYKPDPDSQHGFQLLAGGDARLEGSGSFRGAPLDLSLEVAGLDARSLFPPHPQARETGPLVGELKASVRLRGAPFPTMAQEPAFVQSPHLPGPLRSLLGQYAPEGNFDLELDLLGRRRGVDDPTLELTAEGFLRPLQVNVRYRHFPYDIKGVTGLLRFSRNGIFLDGLQGRHGSGIVRADGKLDNSSSHTAFVLDFSGLNIALDRDLYAALPPNYRSLWEDASPVGLADVHVKVTRAEGTEQSGPLEPRVEVGARLLAGSLTLGGGHRLQGSDGLLRIADGAVQVEDLHGYLGDAGIRVAGVLHSEQQEAASPSSLHLEASNLPLSRSSRVAGPDGSSMGEMKFTGRGDVWGQSHSARDVSKAFPHFAVHIRDGTLSGPAPGAPWENASGWIAVGPVVQQVELFRAQHGPTGRMEAAGRIPSAPNSAPFALKLSAEDAAIDELLKRVIPGRWSEIREALGVSGQGAIRADFHDETPSLAGQSPVPVAEVSLRAARMQPLPLPLDLRDILASVTLRADGFTLTSATARYGNAGLIEVSGTGGWDEKRAWSALKVSAEQLDIDAGLVRAMPAAFAQLLEKLAPSGRARLQLDRLQIMSQQGRNWELAGKLALQDASIQVGLPLRDFAGELVGSCKIDATGDVELAAAFRVDSGALDERAVQRLEGRVVRRPGDPVLHLEDVQGRLCDGEVQGLANIDPASGTYELSLSLHNLSLADFVGQEAANNPRVRSGRLDGHVFLRGRGGNASTRRGGGELRIRGASLLSTRVSASLLEANQKHNGRLREEVDEADVRFAWEGSQLRFNEVDIRSRDQRLVGEGLWDLQQDTVQLTLVAVFSRNTQRVPVLTELLEAAGAELVQYRIEGPVANPRVSVEPLHNLTGPLRRLVERR